jgi:hypothetical protein
MRITEVEIRICKSPGTAPFALTVRMAVTFNSSEESSTQCPD